jgi:hypothetical protein
MLTGWYRWSANMLDELAAAVVDVITAVMVRAM